MSTIQVFWSYFKMGAWEYVLIIAIGVAVAALAFLAVHTMNMRALAQELKIKHAEAEKRLSEARQQAEELVKKALREAKEVAINEGRDFERIQREKNLEIKKIEARIQKREETIEKKAQSLDVKEKELKQKLENLELEQHKVQSTLKKAEETLEESKSKLETVARLSQDEAREQLKKAIEVEVRKTASAEIRLAEDEAHKVAEERARNIIATSIQRIANEFVTDATVSVISLPTDDMKGRIIGREGRNIRTIEQATGVDLIIDDTPEAVIISCFNPVRREIAKTAIERLVADGRIHPARIEEVVQKTRAEFDQMIREAGERSSFDCGITGLHPEVIQALGKLKYMTTGGQSVLQHSIETAQIAGILASELELNVRMAKRAALLHDIGKSLDEETEGHHAHVGAMFLQKYGEAPEVVEAALKHHHENLHGSSLITVVVQTANTLSNFRPGARKEFLEKAIDRLKDMETTVEKFDGVEQAYVIKSGREVRAMVSPTVMDDEAVTLLAKTVAKKLRGDLHQSTNIKVTMVREQRATYLAK
ncbi:ribonuclease Y [Spirobacillus cienkowskii]|jgi:ribonuclease Y|uniref:Ribonuclease Y n=1 Tax=Spirobacillus cienkowskii TaxID=495820 RepID=A0A369KR69_9BACT|nr:MAG: ribonuclease Y [Spirobacillus cienkowskii]